MQYRDTESSVRIQRKFEIADGPILHIYSRSARLFRVERGSITYRLTEGRWLADDWSSVTLAGPILKEDGSDSPNTHKGHPDYDDWRDRDAIWWLAEIIDTLRPTTEIILTTGTWDVTL